MSPQVFVNVNIKVYIAGYSFIAVVTRVIRLPSACIICNLNGKIASDDKILSGTLAGGAVGLCNSCLFSRCPSWLGMIRRLSKLFVSRLSLLF